MKNVIKLLYALLTFATISACTDTCKCSVDASLLEYNDSVKQSIDSIYFWSAFGLKDLHSFPDNAYRLAIIPSWECDKRVYTLVQNNDSAYIYVHKYSFDHYYKYSLISKEKYILDTSKLKEFESMLKNNCFWTKKSDEEETLDGVSWVLEGKINDKNSYSNRNSHIVCRKTDDSTFFMFCDKFLNLANSSYVEQNRINYECR